MHQMQAVRERVQLQVRVPAQGGQVEEVLAVGAQEWAPGSSWVVVQAELALELVRSSC